MSGPARRLPVSRAIAVQVVVVAVVAVVVLVLAVLHLADGGLGLGWAVGGLFGGLVVGLVASRSKRIVCDEGTDTVVSRTGWIGAVILGCFVVAQLVRGWILGHWVDGVGLTTLGLCVTAGTLIGQVVGTRRRVRAARPETGEGS
jgi:hypothetical protein